MSNLRKEPGDSGQVFWRKMGRKGDGAQWRNGAMAQRRNGAKDENGVTANTGFLRLN